MVQFLNTTQSKGQVESILTNAQRNLVMITPFIKFDNDLISRLEDAGGRRNIKITLVCREKDIRTEERVKIEKIPNLDIYSNERVHAKCYYNETCMVITSSNLYDSSKGDNHEMGVVLNGLEEDKKAFAEAINEARFIIAESTQISKPNSRITYKTPEAPKSRIEEKSPVYGGKPLEEKGYCLRCGKNIPFNTDAPYCPKCYSTWEIYKDDKYEEKYCHRCGEKTDSSMKKPECTKCYKRAQRK
jgi:hypothetical protein